jgi:hypothetical protein
MRRNVSRHKWEAFLFGDKKALPGQLASKVKRYGCFGNIPDVC